MAALAPRPVSAPRADPTAQPGFLRRLFAPSRLRTVRRQRRRRPGRVPFALSPHMMRDIGLDPWPQRPHIPSHPLW